MTFPVSKHLFMQEMLLIDGHNHKASDDGELLAQSFIISSFTLNSKNPKTGTISHTFHLKNDYVHVCVLVYVCFGTCRDVPKTTMDQ